LVWSGARSSAPRLRSSLGQDDGGTDALVAGVVTADVPDFPCKGAVLGHDVDVVQGRGFIYGELGQLGGDVFRI